MALVVVPEVAVKLVKVSDEGSDKVTVPSASSVTVTWFAVPAIQVARSVEVACPSEERERRRVGVAKVRPNELEEVACGKVERAAVRMVPSKVKFAESIKRPPVVT